MSKINHLPKTMPSKEIPFEYEGVGATTKTKWKGSFTVKVPAGKQLSQIGLELAKLNEGVPFEWLDANTALLNNAIAYLRVVLVDAPGWFTNKEDHEKEPGMAYGLDTLDLNVPGEIFTKAESLVAKWRQELQGQPKDDKKE